jgi:aspartate/methionine/tyrosine aminotransferase
MRTEFQRRRDAFVAGLNRIKGVPVPDAAWRLLRISEYYEDGLEIEEACRCTVGASGSRLPFRASFGEYGEGYLRFSVANSLENLDEALERIDLWTRKNL